MKEYLKRLGASAWRYILKYPLAVALTVLVVAGALILLALGQKVQIGGIIGKLWGSKSPDVRGVPPADRVDPSGDVIAPGKSDDKGFVQAPVSTTIKDQGMFGDPNTVTVVHPDKGEVKIELPTGVKNKDVKEVVEVSPDVYEVRNHDHGVDTKDVLKSLGS